MRPFDLSKFRKSITKSITGLSVGFNDPKTWVSTGSLCLNFLISGDFNKGIPLGKVSILAGESGCLPESAKVVVRYDRGGCDHIIKVKDLKILWHSTPYEFKIATPDGFQRITAWYDKGVMPMVRVTTKSGLVTECATNHLLQTTVSYAARYPSTGLFCWIPAGELEVNQPVLTENWLDYVTNIEVIDSAECYDFTVDHPNHRYWGDGISSHNSGKSLLSANIIKHAQDMGIYVIVIDSENALDETWLKAFDVDTSEDKLLKLNMAMVDDVAKTISEFVKEYRALAEADRPQVLFVIDSLGMLMTPSDTQQFSDGSLRGNFGLKPKALKALVTNCVNMFGDLGIGLLATNHTYSSQNVFAPDDIVSGGSGPIFASSILVAMKKGKLREDEDGNKTSDVSGIRAMCKVMKTRYNKPFEGTELKIPYSGGLDEYSGLFELFEDNDLLKKDGHRYSYTATNGTTVKLFKKDWNRNTNDCLIVVMGDIMNMPGGLFRNAPNTDDVELDDLKKEPLEIIHESESTNETDN